jgi:hypothetical protein
MKLPFRRSVAFCAMVMLTTLASLLPVDAQQTLGSMSGAVLDNSGGAVVGATVTIVNNQTSATRTETSGTGGIYLFKDLAVGTYSFTVSSNGYSTEKINSVPVQADRTASMNIKLKPGAVSETVEVSATPLLDATDTTNGYVLDASTIQNQPLATGSFTQLAVLTPGVHADLLSDTGTNTGLGNQNIWGNGQRLSSNTFTFDGVIANNLFNGASSSQVSANRAVLNTGEAFQSNGTIRTNTSIYDAIGEALPTPPIMSISEMRVDASMFDASQGATAGAHVDVTTRSGTNSLHGDVRGMIEANPINANPFFNKQEEINLQEPNAPPDLHRSEIGGDVGGPIRKDKLFFFLAYDYLRAADQLNSQTSYHVPELLGASRDLSDLQTMAYAPANQGGAGLTAGTPLDNVAVKYLQAKLTNGQFLIHQPTSTGTDGAVQFTGPASTFDANRAVADIDAKLTNSDTLSGKYYYQQNPTTSPFSSTPLLGFPQRFNSGSQVIAVDNSVILTPKLSWEQKVGFLRMNVQSLTSQPFGPSGVGMNLFGSPYLPGISVRGFNPASGSELAIGPTSNFSNTGFVQNTFEGSSNLNWTLGRHTFSFGANYDFTQLNILNRANQVASISFNNLKSFLAGSPLRGGLNSVYFEGASNRYYRAPQIGAYAVDQFRVTNKLTINYGVRFDYDGGLYEKYGNLVNFDPSKYSYNASSDTITNAGLIIAGNNKQYHTTGASNSTLTQFQGGIGPRVGIAYAAHPDVVFRVGFGLYYDRGEYFTEFSPSAGNGFNGPFGVTLQPPFVQPVTTTASSTLDNPFGTGSTPPPVDTNPVDFVNNLPNVSSLAGGAEPYLFGAYGINNKLPYTENWSFDMQWQVNAHTAFSVGYVGNHSIHQTIPIHFNQPLVATPSSPVNGETYSYGYNASDANGNTLVSEPEFTWDGGNTDTRTPYPGYSPNSVAWTTNGIAHFNALQTSLRRTVSKGLDFQAGYSWSHSLDESSGYGLFYNGNDPRNLRSGYASSDYDRTNVFTLSFDYQVPSLKNASALESHLGGGWGLSGITVLESGQPYNVYDFSGTVGSIFFSSNDYLTNPVLPLAPGIKPNHALTGHSGAFVNPNGSSPNLADAAFNPSAFTYPLLAPGQSGVPPCGATTAGTIACDTVESGFANGGRNIFRGDTQKRADLSLYKVTKVTEHTSLRLSMDVFNVTNTPSFDTPGNNFTGSDFGNPPNYLPLGPGADPLTFANQGVGAVTNPLGGPRQIQFTGLITF